MHIRPILRSAVRFATVFCVFAMLSGGMIAARATAPVVLMVETEPGISIEVLDWGGAGPPLVLLAGLGATARGFQGAFMEALRQKFHVYGITRRGFGASSAPVPDDVNYSADRLGDDVLTVLDHLELKKPLLVGHSLAGEELSSIGSRRPDRVGGLVYMDAGYRYALSGPGLNDLHIDTLSMRRYLSHSLDDVNPVEAKKTVDAFLSELPEFEKELRAYSSSLGHAPAMSADEIEKERADSRTPSRRAEAAILDGEQRYSMIRCPVLVIFAYPHALPKTVSGQARIEQEKSDMEFVDQRIKLFRSLPDVRIVLLPNATHDVQVSQGAEVLKEIDEFASRTRK